MITYKIGNEQNRPKKPSHPILIKDSISSLLFSFAQSRLPRFFPSIPTQSHSPSPPSTLFIPIPLPSPPVTTAIIQFPRDSISIEPHPQIPGTLPVPPNGYTSIIQRGKEASWLRNRSPAPSPCWFPTTTIRSL